MIARDKKTSVRRGGFTLLEVLVASAISAALIVALYAVFHGALRLRESAEERIAGTLPRSYAAQVLRRDIEGIAPPSGILAGPFLGERDEDRAARLDSLEFYTTSGVIEGENGWGDIQKVEYRLEENDARDSDGTKDFVRVVTRNLLATISDEAPEQRLLRNVESLEFSYYDGETWEESWDSTAHQDEAPRAVRVRIAFADPDEKERKTKPFERVFEVIQVAQEISGADAGGEPGGEPDGERPPGGAN